ncbi:hypothetical protein OPV22_012322 [Ensete ventricosum]|uniref:Secreted protein n=1 Tax=Ensete ventricosum TaxID=4639 RepID=A0AAV8R2B5_ENSVE|nr:hypothetical protein OPV22_012322 [Ensete ventricosum]
MQWFAFLDCIVWFLGSHSVVYSVKISFPPFEEGVGLLFLPYVKNTKNLLSGYYLCNIHCSHMRYLEGEHLRSMTADLSHWFILIRRCSTLNGCSC